MSAMPAMTTIAVSPYHHVLLRERFADRTAARLRFAREAFVTTGRLAAGRTRPRCTPGALGHCKDASGGQVDRRERQRHDGCAGEAPPRETPRGPVVLHEHPIRGA